MSFCYFHFEETENVEKEQEKDNVKTLEKEQEKDIVKTLEKKHFRGLVKHRIPFNSSFFESMFLTDDGRIAILHDVRGVFMVDILDVKNGKIESLKEMGEDVMITSDIYCINSMSNGDIILAGDQVRVIGEKESRIINSVNPISFCMETHDGKLMFTDCAESICVEDKAFPLSGFNTNVCLQYMEKTSDGKYIGYGTDMDGIGRKVVFNKDFVAVELGTTKTCCENLRCIHSIYPELRFSMILDNEKFRMDFIKLDGELCTVEDIKLYEITRDGEIVIVKDDTIEIYY